MAEISSTTPQITETNEKDEESGTTVLHDFHRLDFQNGNTLYDDVELYSAELLAKFAPLTASIHHILNLHAEPIPDPSTTLIRRCSNRQGLWITDEDHNPVSVSIVAQISSIPLDSKLGPYLDMTMFNRMITVDSFRRAAARFYLVEAYAQNGSSAETYEVYQRNKERLFNLLTFLQVNTTQYVDNGLKEDQRLYPNRSEPLGITTWVDVHQNGYYGLIGRTLNIFENVPPSSSRTGISSQLMKFKGKLPDPGKLQAAERERNLRALEVQYPVEDVETFDRKLGHWPDPDGQIRALAEKNDLCGVHLRVPDVYDSGGIIVHPMQYESVFVPGSLVFVTLTFRMWDITRGSNGGPVAKPNRLCSNVIEKIRLLSNDADDLRFWLHTDSITERNRIVQEAEDRDAAERDRIDSERREMVRVEEVETKARELAAQKKKRIEDLRLQSSAICDMVTDDAPSAISASSAGPEAVVSPGPSSDTPAILDTQISDKKRKRRDTTPVGPRGKGKGDVKRARGCAELTGTSEADAAPVGVVQMEVDS
ncbi:hypothetical protein BDP27DRAFT_1416536 [Rhodocollybia butyracea]|uniref:Uncharacterized protein n=1 Tax=Rhodocollybia butyracea TaxID=206335 RepID=A0A9P5UCK9_9AGAR|nr:hypothetical protein BDP27DRAFT_1416536 [Rhodocollybia butyracea]